MQLQKIIAILDDVIKEIKNRGYEFRNIDNFER